jgi:hypothetical protein
MTIALPEIPVGTAAKSTHPTHPTHTKWSHRRETNMPVAEPAATTETERPFQLSVVFTTTSDSDAERFLTYIRDNYSGHVRLQPVPNLGSAVSAIMVFHYAFPHATPSFLRGMYGCLASPYSGLCVAIGEEPMMMYAGPVASHQPQ